MMPHDEQRVVFFVHVMKTGGSTALRKLMEFYDKPHRYPLPGMLGAIEEKGLIASLHAVDPDRGDALRWIAPHMPLSVALDRKATSGRPVFITLMLRDGLSRALSHLRQISRRFDHRYSYRRILDLPLLGEFFLSNHQTRVLGSGRQDWHIWDDCIRGLTELPHALEEPAGAPTAAPVDQAMFEAALAGLEQVDILGLQDDFSGWWRACQAAFFWPEEPTERVNVGATQETVPPPPIPDAIVDELRERNRFDQRLYEAARAKLAT